jgi:hypothetical protein
MPFLISFVVYAARTTVSPRAMPPESAVDLVTHDGDFASFPEPLPYTLAIGSHNWHVSFNVKDSRFRESTHCPLCLHSFRDPSANSGPDDLVLGFSTGTPRNLVSFIRTLRTTGSNCSAIAFVDEKALTLCTNASFVVFMNCGLSLINLGTVPLKYQTRIAVARQVVYYGFLHRFHRFYKRILLLDMMDTVFQSDPFTIYFTEDILAVSTECIQYQRCPWNRAWMKSIDPDHIDFYMDRQVINSGLILGSIRKLMQMLAILVYLPDYVNFTVDRYDGGIDQAFVGMIVHRKIAGIHAAVMGPDSGYASLFHCKFAVHGGDDEPIRSKSGHTVFSVMHQYNRYHYLINYTHRNCPLEGAGDYAHALPKQTEILW